MNSQSLADDSRHDDGEDVPAVNAAVTAPAATAVVRTREEHGISRRDIDKYALKVLYRLTRSGFTAYLVGGGVRDLLLGRKPKDFDISTNARPEKIRALFRNCILIGRRFRLAHIRFNDQIIETSTFRRTPEASGDPTDPDADLFQRDDNLFGTPEEDALRRDFTVNGLFYDIDTFSVIDYVGGMEDLAARRIRSIGDPCIRFREDPVRMVRAIRFAARLDFDFDPDTLEAIRKHGEELTKASPARLLEEIVRLFAFASGEKAMHLLHVTGLMKVVLPELSDWLDDPDADTGLFWARLRALDAGDTVLPDATPALIFSTLLADPMTAMLARDRRPAAAKPKFDKIRAFLAPIAQRLRFPRKLTERIVHMFVSQHRFFHAGGRKGQLSGFVTQDWYHEALALAELGVTAEGGSQATLTAWRDLLAERIYGLADGAREERRGEAGRAAEGGEEGSEERKLSRSARRRRNKKRNRRARRDGESRPADAAAPEAGVETPSERESAPRPTPAPETADAAPAMADAAPAVEPEAGAPARRRRAPRKKESAAPATERPRRQPRQSRAARVAEPEPDGPAPAPLTAAAFYTAPAVPEEEAKPAKKPRASRKKKAAEPEVWTEGDAPPKPPAMDRADEAEIPMHWLDEI